jgi:4-amino-4-deoxy-L-arabinose transferase-like glycosyltransferase
MTLGQIMITDRFTLQGWNNDRLNLWFLLGLGVLILAAGLGLRDPWPADEPRFALVAKQMVESGQWLFPFRGGEIYPDKPPMFMWGIAIGYLITGSMRIAFLLPSLLAGLGCIALVYDLSRRIWDRATAFRAGLFLLFTVQFTVQAKQAQIDELVTFFITLGGYGFLRFLLTGGGWRWYYLGWFAAGLGIITKGVGIIAALVLIPAIWTHRQQIKQATKAQWLKGLAGPLALLAACALWVVPMVLAVQHHPLPEYLAYRDNILFRQTVTRYANAWHHIKPFWYYIGNVIPSFWLPWSLLLPWMVWLSKRDIKLGQRSVILLVGYLLLILLFFSASAGKRGVYITPATPLFAMLTAYWLPELLARRWPARLLQGLSWLLSGLFLVAGIVLMAKPALLAKLGDMDSPWLLAVCLGGSGLMANWLLRRQPVTAILSMLTLLWAFYGFWSFPLMNHLRTPQQIMQDVGQRLAPQDELLLTNFREQFLLFADRPLNHFSYLQSDTPQPQDAAVWLEALPHRWVLGPINNLGHCFAAEKGILLGQRHGDSWYLFQANAVLPACQSAQSSGAIIYHYEPKLIVGK